MRADRTLTVFCKNIYFFNKSCCIRKKYLLKLYHRIFYFPPKGKRRMKKIISLALCCVIAASAFASCAQTPVKNYSPKITVSSSEADTYASWLTNRLGDSLENSVYLALGNDSGIDLSNFENDGYVIRTERRFHSDRRARPRPGSTLAVRKYANAVDTGTCRHARHRVPRRKPHRRAPSRGHGHCRIRDRVPGGAQREYALRDIAVSDAYKEGDRSGAFLLRGDHGSRTRDRIPIHG